MSSAADAPIGLDLARFSRIHALMSTVVRAQFLARRARHARQLLERGRANAKRRAAERALAATAKEAQTPSGKFDAQELARRAEALEESRAIRREAKRVIEARSSDAALAALNEAVCAAGVTKAAAARAAQMNKCQAEMMAKLAAQRSSPSVAAKQEAAAVVRELAADPLRAALAREVRVQGEASHARLGERNAQLRNRSSALVTALHSELRQPNNTARLRSVVVESQQSAEEDLQRRLKRGSQRRSATDNTIDWNAVQDEVRMDS